ncbi:TRAM domain-containing protein [Vibrio chagasii]|nr:TRAM domain-containing protein [Vibrio chagasii]
MTCLRREERRFIRILQQTVNTLKQCATSRLMLGTEQRVLEEGSIEEEPNGAPRCTENSRVVNFEGSDLIGQFVDGKITEVFANSLRGEVVRTEKDMDLRSVISPTQNEAKHKTRRRARCSDHLRHKRNICVFTKS